MSNSNENQARNVPKVVILAGVRGSGRTLSLRLLEDSGFTGIDNLPPSVLPRLVDDSFTHDYDDDIVVVAETRTRNAVEELVSAIGEIRQKQVNTTVIFLYASDSTLLYRMGMNSRNDDSAAVREIRAGFALNRQNTQQLREISDFVMDTSTVSPADMKERLIVAVNGESISRTMRIDISSFGFKYSPFVGDLVFDVRFLPNPYYISDLRALTGKDPACAKFVFESKEAGIFIDTISKLIKDLIPAYINQGRSELLIGIGCTGGHHRSVAVAEELGRSLNEITNTVTVCHREL